MRLHRVRHSLWLIALLTLGFATTAFAQVGGPVIIGGDDADDQRGRHAAGRR